MKSFTSLIKLLIFTLGISSLLASACAQAGLPAQKKVGEFELGMSAAVAMQVLAKSYPGCEIVRRNHKDESGEMTEILTEFALDAGDIDKMSKQFKCDHDLHAVDRVNLKFVNPDYIASQPLYEISLRRKFSNPADDPTGKIVAFEELRKMLVDKYGKPSGQSRAKATSASEAVTAGKAKKKSKAVDEDESYNVVYVWGGPGLKPQLFSFCMENCGSYYMTADLTISRKKGQPKNSYYVEALALRMTDAGLDAKQYDWIYERIKRIRNKSKVF